jgi:hypothetical protein
MDAYCTFDPSDLLTFRFEPRRHVPTTLTMTNTTTKRVAFKVKTTNPKKYTVRPSSGLVEGKASKDIVITLNAQKETNPSVVQNCRDKFLIQTTEVGRGVKSVTSELFDEATKGDSLKQHKLRVQIIVPNPVSPVVEGVEDVMHTPSAVASGGKGVTFSLDTNTSTAGLPSGRGDKTKSGAWQGFGLLHLLLVTLLAFALGYYSKGGIPVLDWMKDVVEDRVNSVFGIGSPGARRGWLGL